jgi:murein DD-endopeptidase MepM/ murein hydrolase activator NlpD
MRWTWPVAQVGDRRPVISQEFKPWGRKPHLGVDIMFERIAGEADTEHPARGAGRFYVPIGALVVAAADGIVTKALLVPRGHFVRIRHEEDPHDTLYMHLSNLRVREGDRVQAGQVLGEVGADPLDEEEIVHLHFELHDRLSNVAVDPEPYLKLWPSSPGALGLILVAALVAARMGGVA